MKLLVGLAGRIGAGKGTVAEYLADGHGAEGRRFSDILVDLLKMLYLNPDRAALQKMGASLRDQFGEDVLVNAFKRYLEEATSEIVVVDGVRYPNEVEMLKGFENSLLIFITAPEKLRFERVKKRGEKGEGEISFEEFQRSEEQETERYLDLVLEKADHIVDNSGSLEELHKKIAAII
jgi:dephospho-CoA kinase